MQEPARFPVHESTCGREALVWLSRHREDPPCIAVFDLRMPTVDGWDLLAMRRDARWNTLPVVVQTGPSGELRIYSSYGDMTIEAAIQAGFVHLLAS